MITEELKQLYQTHTGSPATDITELSSSGSNRRYFRLSGSVSLIGVSGTSIEENNAFIYISRCKFHIRKETLFYHVITPLEDKGIHQNTHR